MTVQATSEAAAEDTAARGGTAFADRQNATVQAIRNHHEHIGRTVADHVLTIRRSIDQLASQSARQATLVTFCRTELLPHAAAEEETLYRTAGELPALRWLVDAMLREHAVLAALVDELEVARTPGESLGAAAALGAIVRTHLEKENEVLLPGLVEAGVDLDRLLDGMHEILGEDAHEQAPDAGGSHGCCGGHCGCGGHDPADYDADARAELVDGELDVRTLIPAQRHEQIFATYRALSSGGGFVLINDHDPKPLYYQFAAEHPGEFTWDYVESGPDVWRIRIGRP